MAVNRYIPGRSRLIKYKQRLSVDFLYVFKRRILLFSKLIVLFLITDLSLWSCTEDITDQVKDQLEKSYPRIVVEGEITSDTTAHLVKLSRTSDYFSNKPLEPITGAEVSITDGQTVFMLAESSKTPGNYYTMPTVYGLPGKTYTLSIRKVDIDRDGTFEEYVAKSTLHPMPKVDSISVKPAQHFFREIYDVIFNAQDPPERNYYMFRVRRNGILLTDSLTKISFTDDEIFNGMYIENQSVYNIRPWKNGERLKIGDTIQLESCSISKDYYTFLMDAMLESHGSDPFGGQPANIFTNVEDKSKATGFFIAYDIKRSSAIVRDTVREVKGY